LLERRSKSEWSGVITGDRRSNGGDVMVKATKWKILIGGEIDEEVRKDQRKEKHTP